MTTQADQKADESLPRYEQVKHLILKDIQHRQLKPGDRLPTEAELCRQFGWSRLTIGRAMNDLVTMGVLTRVRGSGTYVAAPKMDRPPRILISDLALRPEGGYSGPIFAGIRDIAGLEKLDLAHYYDAGIPEPQAVLDSKADGVLLLAPQVEDLTAILKLRETSKPVVAMALRSRFGQIATVCTDNLGGMRTAVAHLARLGHQRIALATPGLTSSDVQERILGFHQGCAEANIPVRPEYLLLLVSTITREMLETWFDGLAPRPTAVICNNSLAFPTLHMLWARGLKVPADVSLVVTDDSDLFANCEPGLTVIRQPLKEMGRRSLVKLLDMIRNQTKGGSEVIDMEFIIRNSTAPALESS